jgi:hypothetical protein
MQERFEASIDFVEHLAASGMPYEVRAGHINPRVMAPVETLCFDALGLSCSLSMAMNPLSKRQICI